MAAPTGDAPAAAAPRPEPIKAVPVRHPGRWVAVAVLAVLAAMAVNSLLTNDGFGWQVVAEYLFSPPVLNGLRNTLILTALSMAIGIGGGVLLAVMRLSPNPVARWFLGLHLAVPRPARAAQILFWYFLALCTHGSPSPSRSPEFVSFDTNLLITVFVAALLGLGLNESAYMAEIVRAGLNSRSNPGQSEAASAIGLTPAQALRRVVLPQAMRVIIPPTGNNDLTCSRPPRWGRDRFLELITSAPDLLREPPEIPRSSSPRSGT